MTPNDYSSGNAFGGNDPQDLEMELLQQGVELDRLRRVLLAATGLVAHRRDTTPNPIVEEHLFVGLEMAIADAAISSPTTIEEKSWYGTERLVPVVRTGQRDERQTGTRVQPLVRRDGRAP